jgi:hypothetical protein
MTFDFFKEKFPEIQKMLEKASPSLMDGVISACCGGFYSQNKVISDLS